MIRAWLASLMIAAAPAPAAPTLVQPCLKDCKATEAAYAVIKKYEGYSPYPYVCPAGYPTVGYGHVVQPGEKISLPLTGDAAEALLRKDVARFEADINRAVTVPLWPLQHDGLVSLTFNIGSGAFRSSTLLKRVNAERHAEVPEQFTRWVYAKKRVLPGLVKRRAKEAALYVKARP